MKYKIAKYIIEAKYKIAKYIIEKENEGEYPAVPGTDANAQC